MPLWSLGSAVVLVAMCLGFLSFAHLDEASTPIAITVIGLVVTTVPTLIGAAFAERASRDIRNGTVTTKVKDALEETGVTAAVENANSTTPQTMNALNANTQALTLLMSHIIAGENARNTPRKGTSNDG